MIEINNISISIYIIFAGISVLLGLILLLLYIKNELKKEDIIFSYMYCIIGIVIGSKIFYMIENNLKINQFLDSGYMYSGGILVSLLLVYMYAKKFNINFEIIFSKYSLIYPLIYGITKIGCFLTGCCKGLEYNGIFHITYYINNISINFFPIQIIETLFMLILFGIILLTKSNRNKIIIFFIGFGIIRFIVDFFRYERKSILLNISISQVICIGLIIIGIVLLRKKYIKN